MERKQSELLYQEALQHIVGGVNSPSRSFKAVGGGAPVFMKRAQGAHFWDVDGNRYIDYLAAYGPIITGHAHPHVTEAICRAAQNGTLYGTPTELEIEFAKHAEVGDSLARQSALRQLRHRGRDDDDSRGTRVHEAHQNH